ERELAAQDARVAELERQRAATAEVLAAIRRSPTDLQRVLDTIAESAARLCDGLDAVILRGGAADRTIAAHFGPLPVGIAPGERSPFEPHETPAGQAMTTGRTAHFPDAANDPSLSPAHRAGLVEHGVASILVTPLLRDEAVIGARSVRRARRAPFTAHQIALLESFADQAA